MPGDAYGAAIDLGEELVALLLWEPGRAKRLLAEHDLVVRIAARRVIVALQSSSQFRLTRARQLIWRSRCFPDPTRSHQYPAVFR